MAKPRTVRVTTRTEFRAMTSTGKVFVASQFFPALIGICETLQIPHENVRTLSRDNGTTGSWYVYGTETNMMDDVKAGQRTRWCAVIERLVVRS